MIEPGAPRLTVVEMAAMSNSGGHKMGKNGGRKMLIQYPIDIQNMPQPGRWRRWRRQVYGVDGD